MKIRPIRDLKDTTGIAELCFSENEPVFITNKGREHLVIMSMATYERKLGQAEVEERINTGLAQAEAKEGTELSKFMAELKAKYAKK